MSIAVVNDDGYGCIGLTALVDDLRRRYFSDVYVVAPYENHSGAGGALSLRKDISVSKVKEYEYTASGTPADAAYIAANSGLIGDVEMLVSGINVGSNLADDLFSSGTLGAAMQGRFLRKVPIAFSIADPKPGYIDDAAVVASDIVMMFYEMGFPNKGYAFNVNIPDIPKEDIKGIMYTRVGRRGKPGDCIEMISPAFDGSYGYYRIGDRGEPEMDTRGTDFEAVENGYVSITPVHLDMTAHGVLRGMRLIQKKRSDFESGTDGFQVSAMEQ